MSDEHGVEGEERTIGKYVLGELIGEGGMGAVHRATHSVTGKKVAVKTLHPTLAKQPAVVQRFIAEARAACVIEHPNVVQVFDVGVDETGAQDVPFMVLELLDGESLDAWLEREGSMSPETFWELAEPILDALHVAHNCGVIHRDLKPENIFLARDARGAKVPKLLDFGIAKILDTPSIDGLTKTGTVLGTPNYMSPEQARGEADLDARMDVYAFGVIGYHALSGRLPFSAPNIPALLYQVAEQEPPPLPEAPPAVRDVIFKAMAKKRADRYASADAFRRALAAALELPAPASTIPPPPPRSTPRRAWIAALIVLLLVVGVGVYAVTHEAEVPVEPPVAAAPTEAESEAEPEAEPEREAEAERQAEVEVAAVAAAARDDEADADAEVELAEAEAEAEATPTMRPRVGMRRDPCRRGGRSGGLCRDDF